MASGQCQPVEELLSSGQIRLALDAIEIAMRKVTDLHERTSLIVLDGMAQFEGGNVMAAVACFNTAAELAKEAPLARQAEIVLALFSRESQFQSPDEVIPTLTHARQLVSACGDALSIGGLHLVVARLEACRGNCINARRHLELARTLWGDAQSPASNSVIQLVDSGLEMYGGNLIRATRAARSGVQAAQLAGLRMPLAGSLINLGSLGVMQSNSHSARANLQQALSLSEGGLLFMRLSALDSLAQLELVLGHQRRAAELISDCSAVINQHHLPARSWYDLAHQVTRCTYHEMLDDWNAVVAIVNEADPELARRQFKAVRTSLLGARARALAHLRRYDEADRTLALAVRNCPRGAVDPLIGLEASRAVCAALRGDTAKGAELFDRALAASRAIGHRYHEWWIERARAAAAPTRGAAARPRVREVADAALLLGDVATILGAGHSIDLLAHRVAAILHSTSLGPRVDVQSESGLPYEATPSASSDPGADDAFRIRLRGSDRSFVISVTGVRAIDEITLLKSVADVVAAAVNRTTSADTDDEEQNLWPRTLIQGGENTVFRSPRMVELLRIAGRLAETNLPVLLTGETGTGKEVVARLIHQHSRVRRGPFVPFNCSAMPRELVESQLFGHRRGAFTGASDAFEGVVGAAEGGTLFLDEIGDLDLAVQPKLLRFLESGEILPVGESRPRRVNVRIVAATNAALEHRVEQGQFRSDLLYRIDVARLALPPLRERKDEIPALASLFVAQFSRECQRTGLRLGDDLIAALLLYDWPGNIRQLANELRRVVAVAADGQTLGSPDLSPDVTRAWNERPVAAPASTGPLVHIALDQPLGPALQELERQFIGHAMRLSGGQVTEAARRLGLSRKGLFLKRRRQGLTG